MAINNYENYSANSPLVNYSISQGIGYNDQLLRKTLGLSFGNSNLGMPKAQGGFMKEMFKYNKDTLTPTNTNLPTLGSGTKGLFSGKSLGNLSDVIGKSGLLNVKGDETMNKVNQIGDIASKAASFIPGVGQIVSAGIKQATTALGIVNKLGEKKVKGTNKDLANEVNLGYDAESMAGKTFGGLNRLFGGNKKMKAMKRNVRAINQRNAMKAAVIKASNRDLMASQNTSQDIASRNYSDIMGGYNTSLLSAKFGAKLENIRKITKKVVKHKHGGNVIPSGALHARKNNLPKDIAEYVTSKGIPVVSEEEGGKLNQHAEIEHSEIIFNKEVTQQLESLLNKYNEGDESAAIEAGKLLTYEILENTTDNVGLLQ